MFYALTSGGRPFWMFLLGKNNKYVTIHWLLLLHAALMHDDKDYWRTHLILEDNATPHTAKTTRDVMALLHMPLFLVSPGSYSSCPHEKCFAVITAKVNFKDDGLVPFHDKINLP